MTQPDNRILLDKIEFYITNICNLSCTDCNRFNNYNFKGQQDWSDYKEVYQSWSRLINFKRIVILGGEPLMNPSISKWVKGLQKLWPDAPKQVLTNGTHLNHIPDLYETIRYNNAWLGVSLHNQNETDYIFSEIERFLRPPIVKITGKENNRQRADVVFEDKDRMEIPVWYQDEFYNSAVITDQQGRLTLHNNDPEQAHNVCGFATNKNYHFIRGKLYKCGPVALFPEFDQQMKLAVSDADRELINSYRPLGLDNFDDYHSEFFANLDNPIPQCKFCPANLQTQKIYPLIRKKQ